MALSVEMAFPQISADITCEIRSSPKLELGSWEHLVLSYDWQGVVK